MLNEKILSCLKEKDMETLKALLVSAENVEITHLLHSLSAQEQVLLFELLAKDKAFVIFEQLDTEQQLNLLQFFTHDKAIEFVNNLAPDDRVRLLNKLPQAKARELINSITSDEREQTNILLGYNAQTAGRIMSPEYIALKKDMTIEQALKEVRRQAKERETIYTLYITDNSNKLEGVISLKELIMAKNASKIEDVMTKKVIYVSSGDDQEKVAKLLKELDFLAVPVVDKDERLVGIVTFDDAMDILEEEVTKDIYDQAGLVARKEANRSEVLISGNLWGIWKVRLPFLFITLAAGMLAGLVIEGFEEVLAYVAAVAFFIPLIMDMGGNVGTQSSTVFARGVVLGHINVKHFFKHFTKEVGVGLSLGTVSGIIAGLIASFWQGMPLLGVAVGLAVATTMTLAALLGFLVPFVLVKLNVDQAAGSAPIITSIKDISGLFIYFTFISIFLGNLL